MDIYKEIYKNTQVGVEAIDSLMPHVGNDELKGLMTVQRQRLADINRQAAGNLEYDELKSSGICGAEKGMLKGSIFVKATLTGADDNKLASMLIEGNNMGLNSLQKEINQLCQHGETAPELAQTTQDLYQSNITALRRYL